MIGAMIAKMKVRSAFQALNQRNFAKFSADWREDCVFVYPGDIEVSGKHEGRDTIFKWFENFLDQFPRLQFTLKNIAVDKLFDMVGSNTIIVHWELSATNKDGKEVQNSGVTTIDLKFGKAVYVIDYIFNTGLEWREGWGVAP